MSKSALASITAQYTDSENEEDHHEASPDSENSQASQVIIPPIKKMEKTPETKKKKRSKKSVRRLVSYQDDTLVSDEHEEEEEMDDSESSTSSEEEDELIHNRSGNSLIQKSGNATPMEVDEDETNQSVQAVDSVAKAEKLSKYAHYSFSLPPEPKGKPSQELADKIAILYEKMENSNMDMNRIIQERKEFRNPSIYEKLIQFCDINEFGTNYPPEIYDPLQWGPESFYEELAKVQKNEMVKRQKDKKENDKIEQATAVARKVEEEAKKRKSKWDQPAPAVKATTLTTTVTGTKGTVISAFGSLPKKPAVQ